MKRRIVTVLIVLGVAFVIWLISPAPVSEYGDDQCQVCGQAAVFVVADAIEGETLRFCDKHGEEYRERENVPVWPGEE